MNRVLEIMGGLLNNPFYKQVVTHAPRYLGGSMILALVSLLMNKYYTAVLSPAEFGILALYLTFAQYLQNLLAFTVDSSFQRVYFEYPDRDRKDFFGTIIIFMLASIGVWFMVACFALQPVNKFLGGTAAIYWCSIILAILAVLTNFLNRVSYNESFSGLVFRQNILQSSFGHGGSILLISFAGLGVLGRQMGQVFGLLVNFGAYIRHFKHSGLLQVNWVFRKDIWSRLQYFTLPSFINVFLSTSLSYLDRLFLQYFHGAKEVGIYSLGLLVGQGINMVVEALAKALFPAIMSELGKDYSRNIAKLKKLDVIFCGCLVIFGLTVSVTSKWIILALSNTNYSAAGPALQFVVFAYVMGGFYKNVSAVLAFHGVVWFYPFSTAVTYGMTAILNYTLIPVFHAPGAAYAFFVGAFANSFIIHLIGSKYYFPKTKIILVYSVLFLFVTVIFLWQIGIRGPI